MSCLEQLTRLGLNGRQANVYIALLQLGTASAIEIAKAFASEKSGVFINGILNGVKDALPPDAKQRPGS